MTLYIRLLAASLAALLMSAPATCAAGPLTLEDVVEVLRTPQRNSDRPQWEEHADALRPHGAKSFDVLSDLIANGHYLANEAARTMLAIDPEEAARHLFSSPRDDPYDTRAIGFEYFLRRPELITPSIAERLHSAAIRALNSTAPLDSTYLAIPAIARTGNSRDIPLLERHESRHPDITIVALARLGSARHIAEIETNLARVYGSTISIADAQSLSKWIGMAAEARNNAFIPHLCRHLDTPGTSEYDVIYHPSGAAQDALDSIVYKKSPRLSGLSHTFWKRWCRYNGANPEDHDIHIETRRGARSWKESAVFSQMPRSTEWAISPSTDSLLEFAKSSGALLAFTGRHGHHIDLYEPKRGLGNHFPPERASLYHHTGCWSKDGLKIAYVTNRSSSSENREEISFVDLRTLEQRQVTRLNQRSFFLDWSPDGESIIFMSGMNDGIWALIRADVASGSTTVLAERFENAYWPAGEANVVARIGGQWYSIDPLSKRRSPFDPLATGRKPPRDEYWDLYPATAESAKGERATIRWEGWSIHETAWSPDGDWLAFIASELQSRRPDESVLLLVDFARSTITYVDHGGSRLAWRP